MHSTSRLLQSPGSVQVAYAMALRVVLPLAVGCATYLFRPGEVRAMSYADSAYVTVPLRAARQALGPLAMESPALRVLVNVLPDAAWSFALASFIALAWTGGAPRARTAWLAAGGALAVGFELAQAVGIVRGTFDLLDLIATAFAYAVGCSLHHQGDQAPAT